VQKYLHFLCTPFVMRGNSSITEADNGIGSHSHS
jgi:hypothetical protein